MSRVLIHDPGFVSVMRGAPRIRAIAGLEAGLTVLFLFLFSQALIGPLFADPLNPDASDVLRLIWLPVYAVTLIMVLFRPGAFTSVLTGNLLILALVSLTAISVIWSVSPDTTIRRSFALIMTTMFGFWLASRWSWRELILLIAATSVLFVIGSTFMALAIPALGIDNAVHVGAWKGLWWEKNTMGAMMAWAAVSCYAAIIVDKKRALIWLGFAAWATALVLLSTSKTALLSWSIGTGGAIGIALCRRGFGFATLMLFLLITGASTVTLVLFIAPVEALEALGRDATLTGRTDIWGVLIGQVAAEPWTGYGYRAFWVNDFGPVFWVRQETVWEVPTAHNGWIETALAIGLPGVGLMALVYVQALFRAISRLFRGDEAYWALGYLAMIGLVSISESNLLLQNSLGWVLFVATASKLAVANKPSIAA
jgi:exopolysaccharide production protein ExoQ